MIYTLPLYDSSQAREYVAWHPTPTMFIFQVMDLLHWMSLARATPHMMANAFYILLHHRQAAFVLADELHP